ncbi:MAG: energy transducer TonB [Deltaproteobacteria bacterium]|nr:energy transducer TonB [Deltaproteobacteria bacterium]
MKRILAATVLALGIHGILLGLTYNPLKGITFHRLKPRVMTMTLVMGQPQMPISEPAVKPPHPPVQKHVPVRKVKKKPAYKQPPEPKPKKIVKPVVQPEQKDIVKAISEPTVNNSIAPDKSVQTEISTVPEKASKNGTPAPANEIIREARPLYLTNPPPPYPQIARKRGFQGVVVLEVLVDQNGNAADLRVLSSSGHPILDRTAMAAVKHWTFDPGTRGGEKVKMWVRVPIRFQLK